MFYFSRAEQAVLIVLLAALLVGAGLGLYARGQASAGLTDEPFLVEPQLSPEDASTVVVHVAGEVAHPGIYRMRVGARVYQAISVAGGVTPKADTSAVNLAAPLADGEKVYVPAKGQAPPIPMAGQPTSARPRTPAPAFPTPTPARKLSINAATAEQLETLPGIGPTYAQHIIAYREQLRRREGHGFTSIEELMEVPGIGPKRFSAFKDLIRP